MRRAFVIEFEKATVTSAPSAATDGIEVHDSFRKLSLLPSLVVYKESTGVRTLRAQLFGYTEFSTITDNGVKTDVASSGRWYLLFDTDEISSDANIVRAWPLDLAVLSYGRLATALISNSGTGTIKATTALLL